MCLLPVILIGSLITLHPNHFHPTAFNQSVIEFQTCEHGLGLDVKASPSGIGGIAAQYGFSTTHGPWSATLTPKLGVGFLDRQVPELSSRVNFSLGLQLIVGYQHGRLAVEYWHQSNAGLGDRNAGLDLIAVMGGLSF